MNLDAKPYSLALPFLDYLTANDPTLTTPLNETEKEELYSELATGAETGWDYSTRFVKDPVAGGSNNTNPALRSLNIINNVPVDLNSILCASLTHPRFYHTLICDF